MNTNDKHLTALRIAIAEKSSTYTVSKNIKHHTITIADKNGRECDYWDGGTAHDVSFIFPPNYPGSLDAMHEVETSGVFVGPAEWDKYCDAIRWVITQEIVRKGGPGSICGIVCLEAAVSATALQRAEAFVAACGLTERVKEIEESL